MNVCYLSLGSNRGDRRRNIRKALRQISRLPKTRLRKVSSIYETAHEGPLPRDRKAVPRYLNCCAIIETGLSPMGLLIELKRVEAELGRRPAPRWSPRVIDIDILRYGRRRVRTRFLTVPHPRLRRRRFALAPLAELG